MEKILYLNCYEDGSPTKAWYLLRAQERMTKEELQGWEIRMYKGEDEPLYLLNIEPFLHFKKGAIWTGIWEIDVLCDREQMQLSNWVASNTIFTAVDKVPDRMIAKDHRHIYLPQAVDPEIHKLYPQIKRETDFIVQCTRGGGIYAQRDHCINVMRANFNSQEFSRSGLDDYVKNMNRGKVQFIRSMSTPIGNSELAQRFFESMAIGPVLTNYCEDLEMLDFVDGEDLLTYNDDSEMIEKMRWLLDHPKEASRIAKNGRKKVLANHKYEDRIITIIKYLHAAFDNLPPFHYYKRTAGNSEAVS